jgi:8-oxo-dGTP pyrophosphatase MutT (NUDIX family)
MKLRRSKVIREVSAGGLVLGSADPTRVALISHRNRAGRIDWCIPKGHRETGETLEQTAIREIFEETGLEVKVLQKLGEIRYRFRSRGSYIDKTVHHFLMLQVGGDLSHLMDPTGEVIDVGWFALTDLSDVLAHENERQIAAAALELARDS